MVDPPPGERRIGTRAPIELKVEYKRLNTFFADYTRNISRGGTFIKTDRPLNIGTEFVFALVVPNLSQPLRLKGRVQWITPVEEADEEHAAGMGIQFVYEQDSDRIAVEAVVERLMTNELGEVLSAKLLGKQ